MARFLRFERYVNFEFYKTNGKWQFTEGQFERYVNFEFYKTVGLNEDKYSTFERYVNFEFYKTCNKISLFTSGLRDM